MSATSLLSLPVELLFEIGRITDRTPSPPSYQKPAPPPSPGLFQLPPILTPGSAPFTPLGRIADTGTANGGDYFGVLGRGPDGFVLGNGRGSDHGSASRRGSAIELNNFLHPEDRRGSEDALGLGIYASRRTSISASLRPSVMDKYEAKEGIETLRILSEVCKELREMLWPLLLGRITLDLRKVREILGSPAKDAFAQTVRHLQLDLYPNDPTSLDDISTFLRIVHTHLYSLQFRFHPLPLSSNLHSARKGKRPGGLASSAGRELDNRPPEGPVLQTPPETVEPRRKLFHLPCVAGFRNPSRPEGEPVFYELQTLRLKGFGSISTLEANILQQAPKLCTLDMACQPVALSRAYDVIESLKMYCPSLENLRMEIDPSATASSRHAERSTVKEQNLDRELCSFINKIFTSSNRLGSTTRSSDPAQAHRGSLRSLRSVDLLCVDFAAKIGLEDWNSLAKVIVDNAPHMRALQLPVNPGLYHSPLLRDIQGIDVADKRKEVEERVLYSLFALDNTRYSGDRNIATDAIGPGSTGEEPCRYFFGRPAPTSRLDHLEYLEFKLDSERKQTIIDPLVHTDDHPFHSRILPPDEKVDEDPGRIGRFISNGVAVAPRLGERSAESEEISIRPTALARSSATAPTWRWESSGKLLECEHYTVWSATIDRNGPPSCGSTSVGISRDRSAVRLLDFDMDHRAASARKGHSTEEMRVMVRKSGHHRW